MVKRILLVAVIIIGIVFVFASCELADSHRLNGDWTITTTPATGTDLGNGTFSVSYDQSMTVLVFEMDLYAGTAVIGGVDYEVMVTHITNTPTDNFSVTLFTDGDDPWTATDYMSFTGTYSSSTPIAGDYDGTGSYAANTGTHITTQQQLQTINLIDSVYEISESFNNIIDDSSMKFVL